MTELDLIAAIDDRSNLQKDIAAMYAQAIRAHVVSIDRSFDWKAVNNAIVERWSLSGLRRIKQMAWNEPAKKGQ